MKIVLLTACLCLLASICFAQTDDYFIGRTQGEQGATDDYLIGKMQGEQDARGNPAWLLAGVGLGCFGVGFAYLSDPKNDINMILIVEKPALYKIGYIQGYRNKSRSTNIMYACFGWLTWVGFYMFIINTRL